MVDKADNMNAKRIMTKYSVVHILTLLTKSVILYLEFMVRVCNASSASLIRRVDICFGIFTDANSRVLSSSSDDNAALRIFSASVRVRQLSSFSSSESSFSSSDLTNKAVVAVLCILLVICDVVVRHSTKHIIIARTWISM